MDDIAEQQQLAGEISTAISNPVGFDQDVDEVCLKWDISRLNKNKFTQNNKIKKDELLKELEELQENDIESELLNIPSAPSHNLPQATNKGIFNATII